MEHVRVPRTGRGKKKRVHGFIVGANWREERRSVWSEGNSFLLFFF